MILLVNLATQRTAFYLTGTLKVVDKVGFGYCKILSLGTVVTEKAY